jgi:phosphoglycerate-specific signal transduction histidine kinase
LWYEQREAVLETYRSEMPERVALSQNDAFKSIKNAVIAEAVKLEIEQMQIAKPVDTQGIPAAQSNTGDAATGSLRLLGQLARLIENEINFQPQSGQEIDQKLRSEIAEKKRAMGLRLG